ncbi:MAG: biotin/lipoyl-containing protein [Polyangiales bacterium]
MSERSHVLRERAGQGPSSDLLAPTVGVFTSKVTEGEIVSAGQTVGTIETLGVRWELSVPAGVAGRITKRIGGQRARVPVEYGAPLLTVSKASMRPVAVNESSVDGNASAALAFVAPMSGRFYSRPSPNEAPYICAGDTVQHGQTVGLLEVMKTFNRLVYQGESLPEQARVESIVPAEGDDVVRGDVILVLASAIGV